VLGGDPGLPLLRPRGAIVLPHSLI